MNRSKLRKHKSNKVELELIEKELLNLERRLSDVEIVAGKVTKSSDDFPYIEEHVTVKMEEPHLATKIKMRIQNKKSRKKVLELAIREVEAFIDAMPEGIEKQIFELSYLEGYSYQKVGELLGYSKGRISQKISNYLKD